jgi:pilus assembly protein Flp/PilA
MKDMLQYINARFGWDQEGATAVEYGIMVALIAVAIIIAVTAVGTELTTLFNKVATELK